MEIHDEFDDLTSLFSSRDEYTRGAYTHVSPGNSPTDYDTIAKPIWNSKLFFAGEHTSRKFPATVHGAMLAGMEVASGVADMLMGSCVADGRVPASLNLHSNTGCVIPGCVHTEIPEYLSLMDHVAMCHQPLLSDRVTNPSNPHAIGSFKTIGRNDQQQQQHAKDDAMDLVQPLLSQQQQTSCQPPLPLADGDDRLGQAGDKMQIVL
jgi:hypothetical protein